MAMLFELKQQREAALAKAEAIVTSAETAKRNLSETELTDLNAANAEVDGLSPQIASIEKANTLRALAPRGSVVPAAQTVTDGGRFSKEYVEGFAAYGKSRGNLVADSLLAGADELGGFQIPNIAPTRSAISYEGRPEAAGIALPVTTVGEIIPLPPPVLAAYGLVTVVPTTTATIYPRQTAFASAFAKAESGTTLNYFQGTDPTIDSFTLGANMMGIINDASWELLQDLPQWFQFLKTNQLTALAVKREYAILKGIDGICQSLVANVAVGEAAVQPDGAGNKLPVSVTLDILGQLDPAYDNDNTSWLMHRRSSIALRQQQLASNLFDPYFNRVGSQDFLHGYPVKYSAAMDTLTAGATPVLFGDFKAAYIFGERGGSGVNVKVLDQTKAAAGVLQVLAYQRVDGHVRLPQAVQAITLHA